MRASSNAELDASTGAIGEPCFAHVFTCKEFRDRAQAATDLCRQIANCDPDDAIVILSAVLDDLSVGSPPLVFVSAMDDARWWAFLAAPHELKAYLLACFEALRPEVQAAFLAYVQRGAA